MSMQSALREMLARTHGPLTRDQLHLVRLLEEANDAQLDPATHHLALAEWHRRVRPSERFVQEFMSANELLNGQYEIGYAVQAGLDAIWDTEPA